MDLLVRAQDGDILMANKAKKIEQRQGHARTSISRKEYITLQCHISECMQHQAAILGKEINFASDFQGGHAGFTVQFSWGRVQSFT